MLDKMPFNGALNQQSAWGEGSQMWGVGFFYGNGVVILYAANKIGGVTSDLFAVENMHHSQLLNG